MKFRSYVLMNDYYTCEVKNTKKGIEISGIKELGRETPRHADDIRNELLSVFKSPYSHIKTSTKEGRKALSVELKEQIELKLLEVEQLKIAVQMCRKNNVYFK